MTDAVDRAEDNVGLTENATELPFVVLDASIMMDEVAVQPLHELAEVTDDSRSASDVRNPASAEIDRHAGSASVVRRVIHSGAHQEFEGIALGVQFPNRRTHLPVSGTQRRQLALEVRAPP